MSEAVRVPVLMYHRVGQPDHAADLYCVTPERFAAQMKALAKAGYQAVLMDDFAAWRRGLRPLPEGAFVLTFDDGFAGVCTDAAPVLKGLGWPATVFLVGNKIGQQSDWQVTTDYPMAPHPLLDARQIQALAAQDFSFQSHSLLHHDLTTLEEAALATDLQQARARIAEVTGVVPAYLAYPYGRHDQKVTAAAARAGHELGFTVESGFNRRDGDPYKIRRLDVFGTDTPRMLLRKLRLGTNDGRFSQLMQYYLQRALRRT